MKQPRYLSAQEAADELGISLSTLYAYVSRGLIRSEPTGDRKRTHRYRAEDVHKLRERKEHRRDPAKAVEEALHWGAPVLESAITLISDNHLYYRGRDVLDLAANHTVEQVAALIWTGAPPAGRPELFAGASGDLPARCRAIQARLADLPPFERFQILLPLAAVDDVMAYDLRPAAVAQTGVHILRLLATIAGNVGSPGPGIAQTLQRGWVPQEEQAEPLLSQALILCADHELNASSFTARCVASTGAAPYEVVIAGLAALHGVKHGRMTERVTAFFEEAGRSDRVRAVIANRLRRGDPVPGFGHPLYPDGDPRGKALLELATAAYPDSPAVGLARAAVEAVSDLMGEYPTLDVGLVTLSQALQLPAGGPLALFALGRTIGWMGHALEQYAVDRMIRPRARYTGDLPPLEE